MWSWCRWADLIVDVLPLPLQAGKAVKMLSGVPFVGALSGPIATALEAGDGYVQTTRLEKVGVSTSLRYFGVAARNSPVNRRVPPL